MALGVISVIPNLSHKQILVGAGNTQWPSVRVLNPNDGILYIARNRDCTGTDYGSWEWKIPSQSFAILPGESAGFMSVGAFYLDQSGGNRAGEITIYPSLKIFDDAIFNA